jgi:uncharacterized iron-regulated membrane protein
MRRILLNVHRWVGLVAGVYVVVISVTGAALVFRIDLQRASHPHLFTASEGATADPVAIMDSVARAYPDHRLSGVDAPTTTRPTYLAYVTSSGTFKTVLVDPVSAHVLGELPERTAVRMLQDLHFDLLTGRTGRTVNGVGAIALIVLAVTGFVEWSRRGWQRVTTRSWRELHRTVGIFSVLLLLMWAVTGVYFAFPSTVRSLIGRLSSLSVSRTPASHCPSTTEKCAATAPSWRSVLDAAQQRRPGAHIARVVLPLGDRGSWLVMFTDRQPTPAYTELDSVYIDQYSTTVIEVEEQRASAGDRMTRAIAPLHVGAFGGTLIRSVWLVFGLAPSFLALTGAIIYFRRGTQ